MHALHLYSWCVQWHEDDPWLSNGRYSAVFQIFPVALYLSRHLFSDTAKWGSQQRKVTCHWNFVAFTAVYIYSPLIVVVGTLIQKYWWYQCWSLVLIDTSLQGFPYNGKICLAHFIKQMPALYSSLWSETGIGQFYQITWTDIFYLRWSFARTHSRVFTNCWQSGTLEKKIWKISNQFLFRRLDHIQPFDFN